VLWSGAANAIPSGWALCNGSNGTPDLRNRFVVGAGDTYAIGSTGGAESVSVGTANMPSHKHGLSGSVDASGDLTFSCSSGSGSSGYGYLAGASNGGTLNTTMKVKVTSASLTLSGNTGDAGQQTPTALENRPPYYALCYIMRVA
jgi:microcystin-dependent protein